MTGNGAGALYELTDVRRVYRTGGGEVRAVDGIDLTVARGELLAIEGPSGSGKSTLLQLLGVLDRPTSGTLFFDGHDLTNLSERERTRLRSQDVGFVFQTFNLIPTLTAAENVEAAMVPLVHDASRRRERVAALLERVGLAHRSMHLPSTMSGGEQQRVAIARALANEPRAILADEPTGNLDSTTAEEVVATLRSLSDEHGVTVIIVTHAEEIASQTQRRIRLRDGRVVNGDELVGSGVQLPNVPVIDLPEGDPPRELT